MDDIEDVARRNEELRRQVHTRICGEAFKDEYCLSEKLGTFQGHGTAPTLRQGRSGGINLNRSCSQNAQHKDWACTEDMMKLTRGGKALYMHCLPADISGVSCEEGEVDASVFDRYRIPLYKEASYKPYIIAAMIFLQKIRHPGAKLEELWNSASPRWADKG